MATNSNGISATVEILPLVKGLYLFSVQATDPQQIGDDHELTLPALQVTLGPGTPASHVEFMYGPRTEGAWLCGRRDTIVVKVNEASTVLLLTSLTLAGAPGLQVSVKRLDGAAPVSGAARPTPQPAPQPAPERIEAPMLPQPALASPMAPPPVQVAPPAWHNERSIRLAVTVHVRNRGDLNFSEAAWAGAVGQQLAIESFTISTVEDISPDIIEYKAVTNTGMETPWVSGGSPCGTRGMSLPLVGFAIRMKSQTDRNLVCQYGPMLISGKTVGPAQNGAPCRTTDANDAIEAIWVSIFEDARPAAAGPEPQPEGAPARRSQIREGVAGPKFSVFREPADPAAN